MLPALVGVGAGLVGAGALNRSMQSLLFGIEGMDGVTYGAVVATLLLVALVACWLPARRAGRLDPARVLG